MSYPSVIAAALSGATLRQLSYWRSSRSSEPLLAPQKASNGRTLYSFEDVVALRTFVYLRAKNVSLQRVRKAVENLRKMGELDHLSTYSLVAIGKDVVWRVSDTEAVDLTGSPGQGLIAQMVDIIAGFTGPRDREVVPLIYPKPGVKVDKEVRGGYPVIEGTRIPFNLVASLVEDGVSPEDISNFYPAVDGSAARGATEFSSYVKKYSVKSVA